MSIQCHRKGTNANVQRLHRATHPPPHFPRKELQMTWRSKPRETAHPSKQFLLPENPAMVFLQSVNRRAPYAPRSFGREPCGWHRESIRVSDAPVIVKATRAAYQVALQALPECRRSRLFRRLRMLHTV
mmetsp:Transcript_134237/g.244862  ORF Transcript_134237/g.244862 Transcript_134237/m.244862 type:complete len:129 (-) Transcript_134237:1483-1869(-)